MRNLLIGSFIIMSLAVLAVAQQPAGPALQESAVKMSGKNISLKYSPVPVAAKKIAGVPAPFHTDVDLEIQGLPVPKGDYTLYVLPDAKEWQLIISKQTGAQAAAYNQKLDLGRVPMDMKKAAAPAAALQMKLASLGSVAGKLDVFWESTLASVPFNIDAVKANAEW
jgi:hypothetical protein